MGEGVCALNPSKSLRRDTKSEPTALERERLGPARRSSRRWGRRLGPHLVPAAALAHSSLAECRLARAPCAGVRRCLRPLACATPRGDDAATCRCSPPRHRRRRRPSRSRRWQARQGRWRTPAPPRRQPTRKGPEEQRVPPPTLLAWPPRRAASSGLEVYASSHHGLIHKPEPLRDRT